MAATNKCLARSNKSSDRREATNKRSQMKKGYRSRVLDVEMRAILEKEGPRR
jgi:hypothetical protein